LNFTQFVSRFSNQVAGRTANGEVPHRTYTYVYYVTPCKFHVWSCELSKWNASRGCHVLCFGI